MRLGDPATGLLREQLQHAYKRGFATVEQHADSIPTCGLLAQFYGIACGFGIAIWWASAIV